MSENSKDAGVPKESRRARVQAERERRGWSYNVAAAHGGCAGETWRKFEKTGNLTYKMRQAIAQAFDWPPSWHEFGSDQTVVEFPTPANGTPVTGPSRVSGLSESQERTMARNGAILMALSDEVFGLRAQLAPLPDLPEVIERLGQALTHQLDEIQSRLDAIQVRLDEGGVGRGVAAGEPPS